MIFTCMTANFSMYLGIEFLDPRLLGIRPRIVHVQAIDEINKSFCILNIDSSVLIAVSQFQDSSNFSILFQQGLNFVPWKKIYDVPDFLNLREENQLSQIWRTCLTFLWDNVLKILRKGDFFKLYTNWVNEDINNACDQLTLVSAADSWHPPHRLDDRSPSPGVCAAASTSRRPETLRPLHHLPHPAGFLLASSFFFSSDVDSSTAMTTMQRYSDALLVYAIMTS